MSQCHCRNPKIVLNKTRGQRFSVMFFFIVLEKHIKFIAPAAIIMCALAFVVLPVVILDGMENEPKLRRFILLFYAGIIQSQLVGRLVSNNRVENNGNSGKTMSIITIALFLFIISVYTDPTSKSSGPIDKGTGRQAVRGNCTLLDEIPSQIIKSKKMFFNSNNGILHKYAKSTVDLAQSAFIMLGGDKKGNGKCKKDKFSVTFLTYLLFPPCKGEAITALITHLR